jgi:uncharacterized protein (DUF4415 family)
MTLRLDPDVLDRFRVDGPGWQGRINAALRKAVVVRGFVRRARHDRFAR